MRRCPDCLYPLSECDCVDDDGDSQPERWLDHLARCPDCHGAAIIRHSRSWRDELCAAGLQVYERDAAAWAGGGSDDGPA